MKKKKQRPARRRKKSIDTNRVKNALEGLGGLVRGALGKGPALNPDNHVDDLRNAVEELQSAVADFKREIKRRMLADKLTVPRKNKPYLVLLPGRHAGSQNPDDYEVNAEYMKKVRQRRKYVM